MIFDDPRLTHSTFYANFLDSKTLFWISAQRQPFRCFIFLIVNRIVGCGATSTEVFDHKNINRKLNIHIFFLLILMPLVHLAMKGAEKSLEKFIGRQKKITKRIETVLNFSFNFFLVFSLFL